MTRGRQAITIGGGLVLGSALLFARTLVLAALIPAADYGRAAILAVMMSIIELAVTTGTQIRVFQHPSGESDTTLNALHGFQIFRGVMGALVVLALAWPLATLVDMPGLAAGFAAMAILPVVLGTAHLDPMRQMRLGRYGPQAFVSVLPAALSLAAIWPLAAWLGDWRAFIGMQLVYALGVVATTHGVARGSFRPSFTPEFRETALFYLPLLATGVLILIAMQGDRVLVARAFTETELAGFAVALALTVPAVQIAIRALSSLYQPKLAQVEDAELTLAARKAYDIHVLSAAALIAGSGLLGPWVISVLFNTELQPAGAIIAAAAAAQAIRLMRVGICITLQAKGDGISDFLSNLPRLVALALTAVALAQGGGFQTIIALAAAGELAGLGVALWRLRPLIPIAPLITASLWPLPLCAVAVWQPENLPLLAAACLATALLALIGCPTLRAVALRLRPNEASTAHAAKPL